MERSQNCLCFAGLKVGSPDSPLTLGFALAGPAELQVLLVFSVDRSHASISGKLTNAASTFSVVVQRRLPDIAD